MARFSLVLPQLRVQDSGPLIRDSQLIVELLISHKNDTSKHKLEPYFPSSPILTWGKKLTLTFKSPFSEGIKLRRKLFLRIFSTLVDRVIT